MFDKNATDYDYQSIADIIQDDYIYFPCELDTEYTSTKLNPNNVYQYKNTILTIQCRSINKEEGIIYAARENPFPRHKVIKHSWFFGYFYGQLIAKCQLIEEGRRQMAEGRRDKSEGDSDPS